MKKILGLISGALLWSMTLVPANADFGAGVSLMVGELETDGTETEKAVTGVTSQKTSKTLKEGFYGASVYAEYRFDNRIAFGVEYVPMDLDVGAEKRTDTSAAADVASEADTGERKADAVVQDLMNYYLRLPVPTTDRMYVKLGYMDADVTINETLPTSSYANTTLEGIEYGIGFQTESGRGRFELAYADFDEISVTATGNTIAGDVTGQNKVTADADSIQARLSFGF